MCGGGPKRIIQLPLFEVVLSLFVPYSCPSCQDAAKAVMKVLWWSTSLTTLVSLRKHHHQYHHQLYHHDLSVFFNGPDDDGVEYDQGQGGQEDVAKPSQPQHVHIHIPGRRFFITMIL